jgi:hypothetical protein
MSRARKQAVSESLQVPLKSAPLGVSGFGGARGIGRLTRRALPEDIGHDGFSLIADRVAKDLDKLGSPAH